MAPSSSSHDGSWPSKQQKCKGDVRGEIIFVGGSVQLQNYSIYTLTLSAMQLGASTMFQVGGRCCTVTIRCIIKQLQSKDSKVPKQVAGHNAVPKCNLKILPTS